jgi:predicted phage terminase large subunit-like protein
MEFILGTALPPSPLERYVPHTPWPKQREFLDLDSLEAFYGGAAAGGKSEALLMAALQYVDVPGYAALILRRDTQRLTLSGGLIPRSHEWLAGKGAKWNGVARRWTFPTAGAPATLSFGYLQSPTDRYRYGSSEYQYIAFDELTEFPEQDYLFLFSRLRRTGSVAAPLRMRAASNPGYVGHAWVKARFIHHAAPSAPSAGVPTSVLWQGDRAYVPARICDNPAIEEAEYRRSLLHLPHVERERLMNGDWNIRPEGLIRSTWLRYYQTSGQQLRLLDPRPGGEAWLDVIDERACRRFATIDPAGTSELRAAERRGRPASYSVIAVWDQPIGDRHQHLLLRHVHRARLGFEQLCAAIRSVHREWKPALTLIENEKVGQAAVDVLHRELPIRTVATAGKDKVTRAAPLLVKLERGEIWLPEAAPWLADFENELIHWTGLPEETSDQIDAAAYAVLEAASHCGAEIFERPFRRAA